MIDSGGVVEIFTLGNLIRTSASENVNKIK